MIVDNTFLGPLWQKPLKHGADICITSLTKYVGGHSDLIAGAASGAASWVSQVAVFRTIFGTMTDPHTAWLLLRSLETLKLRMDAAELGARKVAAYLSKHPRVKSVWYLGFLPKDHPDRPLFERQCEDRWLDFRLRDRRRREGSLRLPRQAAGHQAGRQPRRARKRSPRTPPP